MCISTQYTLQCKYGTYILSKAVTCIYIQCILTQTAIFSVNFWTSLRMVSHSVGDGEVSFVVPSIVHKSSSINSCLLSCNIWPLTALFCSSLSSVNVCSGRSQSLPHVWNKSCTVKMCVQHYKQLPSCCTLSQAHLSYSRTLRRAFGCYILVLCH